MVRRIPSRNQPACKPKPGGIYLAGLDVFVGVGLDPEVTRSNTLLPSAACLQ